MEEIDEMNIEDLEEYSIPSPHYKENPYAFTPTMMDLNILKEIYKEKINKYLKRQNKEFYVYSAEEIADLLCFNWYTGNSILSVLPSFIYCTYLTEDWTKKVDNILEKLSDLYDNYLVYWGSFQEFLNKTIKELGIELSNFDQSGDIVEQFKEFWIDEAKGI